jgi:hypothetical protein
MIENFKRKIKAFEAKSHTIFLSVTGTWAKCQYRHKTGIDCQKTSPCRPNKGYYKHFSVLVLDQSVSISVCLVPGPALCPEAAERPQEYCI